MKAGLQMIQGKHQLNPNNIKSKSLLIVLTVLVYVLRHLLFCCMCLYCFMMWWLRVLGQARVTEYSFTVLTEVKGHGLA